MISPNRFEISPLESKLAVSRETRERLEVMAALVEKWQPKINLISPATLPSLWERHVFDSLQLGLHAPLNRRWADLGSGAGFPGLVTAIALVEKGEGWVHLIESNNKKAAFLRQVVLETGARASIHAVRVDAAVTEVQNVDAISARALASLDQLLQMSEAWALKNPFLVCWFHKGLDYLEEVRSARGRWAFDLVEHPSLLQEGSAILEISNLRRLT